jgi:hypothetical protein
MKVSKKTKLFEALSEPMRLQAYLFFEDPKQIGITFSELTKSGINISEINKALDMWQDNGEIEMNQTLRNGFYVSVYKLTRVARSGIGGLINPSSFRT